MISSLLPCEIQFLKIYIVRFSFLISISMSTNTEHLPTIDLSLKPV